MNPDIKRYYFRYGTVSFLTQKSCMSVFGVRRLFFTATYGNAPRTQYSLNGSSGFAIAKLRAFSGRILTTARFTIKELSLWISSSRKTALNQSPVPLNFSVF